MCGATKKRTSSRMSPARRQSRSNPSDSEADRPDTSRPVARSDPPRRTRRSSMILVTSSPSDVHAQEVLKKLDEQGVPGRLLDLSLIPVQMSLTGRYPRDRTGSTSDPRFELRFPDGAILDLADVKAVWWRQIGR